MESVGRRKKDKKKDLLARDLMTLSGIVTLVFSSSLTVDAFTPIKFASLVLGLFYIYIRHWNFILSGLVSSKKLTLLTGAFFTHSVLILVLNRYSISERLFGFQGRYFGFITIWSLYLLGLVFYLAVKSKRLAIDLVLKFLLFTNLFVVLVFFIQELGIGFTKFQNDFAVLPSTLGNPNFLAAFVACSVFSAIYFLLAPKWRLSLNYWLATTSIVTSLYIAAISDSLQGPLGICLGTICLVFLYSVRTKPKITIVLAGLLSLFSVFLVQGFFGRGFLADRLEQGTLAIRSAYWVIALRMGIDRPFFGQGFDSYLDHYRAFRSPSEISAYGTGVISDSPHNLYLDFLVSGGFPYLLWVLLGISYVIFSAINILRLLRRRGSLYIASVFLITIWFVLSALALINPFQIAVNIWNAVTGFVIVGYYHQLHKENHESSPLRRKNIKHQLLSKIPIVLSLVVFVNPLVAILPMVTEIRFRSAVEKSDYNALRSVAMDWPFSGTRVAAISQGIINSSLKLTSTADLKAERRLKNMIQSANADALAATKINEKSFELWRFIFYNNPNPLVIEKAREALIRLDPQDPSWVTAKP